MPSFITFDTAIDRVLKEEGGYVNNPADPGGETKFGISKRSYPQVDIANLTREEAAGIYKRDFWDRCHCDAMPGQIAYQALDFAVNSGIETSIRKLQAALGVADDGWWGPETQNKLVATPVAQVGIRFVAQRLEYMRHLSAWPRFSVGWTGRIVDDLFYLADDLP